MLLPLDRRIVEIYPFNVIVCEKQRDEWTVQDRLSARNKTAEIVKENLKKKEKETDTGKEKEKKREKGKEKIKEPENEGKEREKVKEKRGTEEGLADEIPRRYAAYPDRFFTMKEYMRGASLQDCALLLKEDWRDTQQRGKEGYSILFAEDYLGNTLWHTVAKLGRWECLALLTAYLTLSRTNDEDQHRRHIGLQALFTQQNSVGQSPLSVAEERGSQTKTCWLCMRALLQGGKAEGPQPALARLQSLEKTVLALLAS